MRIEPSLNDAMPNEDVGPRESRALVPYTDTAGRADGPRLPGMATGASADPSALALTEFTDSYDVGAISPRKMVDLSLELYISGYLTKDQYQDMAFQSELLPNFDDTIGALTGERAAPDKPRDYVKIWQKRLNFEEEHSAEDRRVVDRTRQILDLLLSIKPEKKPTKLSDRNPLAHIRASSRRP